MKQDTKYKIIKTGAQIIQHKGYHHTGIQEVLKTANVPKGSFYFYFKNKEDFGLSVIDFFDNMYFAMIGPIIENKNITPVNKIEGIFDHFIKKFKEIDYQCGCPIGNLSQEMGELNQTFSDKLTESVKKISKAYQNILDEAILKNEIHKGISTDEMADFIVTSWHGALIKMKINKDTGPLKIHKKFILNILKA